MKSSIILSSPPNALDISTESSKIIAENLVVNNIIDRLLRDVPNPVAIVVILAFSIAVPFASNLLGKDANSIIHRIPSSYRFIWVAAFLLNLITVQIPGRFDGQVNSEGKVVIPWETVFAPAGFAFAIWAVIYLGEMFTTGYIGIVGGMGSIEIKTIQKATQYWLVANVFQSLWCFAFRPKFREHLWLPTLLLALGSVSLFGAHNVITNEIGNLGNQFSGEKLRLQLVRGPLTLHATWLTAASLLNLNGWAAVSKLSVSSQVFISVVSAFMATALTAYLTFTRRDPLIALTGIWVFNAISVQVQVSNIAGLSKYTKDSFSLLLKGLMAFLATVIAFTYKP